jgi:hypothetical protein
MLHFVNIVNLMNDFLNPKSGTILVEKDRQMDKFSEKGLYVREDDQDWGSAGMDNIHEDSK